jgi:hypothetical protein
VPEWLEFRVWMMIYRVVALALETLACFLEFCYTFSTVVTPSFWKGTECISYVRQDQVPHI